MALAEVFEAFAGPEAPVEFAAYDGSHAGTTGSPVKITVRSPVAVAYLSGELPQRQIGVGWAALRDGFAPADTATLTLSDVDSAFSAIGAVSGKGSAAARKAGSAASRPSATAAAFTTSASLSGRSMSRRQRERIVANSRPGA